MRTELAHTIGDQVRWSRLADRTPRESIAALPRCRRWPGACGVRIGDFIIDRLPRNVMAHTFGYAAFSARTEGTIRGLRARAAGLNRGPGAS